MDKDKMANDLISRQAAIDMLIHSDIEKRRSEQE